MAKREKLLESIRGNPLDVRFDDACLAATLIGFAHKGGKGDHKTYARSGEAQLLNFQNRDGKIKPYQARQLIVMIDRYEND